MTDTEDKWASLAAELGLSENAPTDRPSNESDQEQAPRRGRGRSRRGGQRKRPQVEPAVPEVTEDTMDEMVTEEAPAEMEGAPVKKRRRRRSRKKKGTSESVSVSNGETAVAVSDDDDDADDVPPTEWKMPSWQELIDSLHRP